MLGAGKTNFDPKKFVSIHNLQSLFNPSSSKSVNAKTILWIMKYWERNCFWHSVLLYYDFLLLARHAKSCESGKLVPGNFWSKIRISLKIQALKGVLSGYKSVTGISHNNPKMRSPFSVFMNFHPKVSDSCSGLIIRLEWSQCCN